MPGRGYANLGKFRNLVRRDQSPAAFGAVPLANPGPGGTLS